jgi:hypothetical protein
MSNEIELYKTRLSFDSFCQPTLRLALEDCDAFVQSIPKMHPYSLSNGQCQALADHCNGYKCGCQGQLAVVVEPFLYRITTMPSILGQNTPNSNLHSEELYEFFLSEFKSSTRWISLSRLIQGEYQGWRGFTFWTNLEFAPGDLLSSAYKLGVPRNYISPRSVVLRCPSSLLRSRIPTILDGYDFPPFCAADHPNNDGCGRAVDLTSPDTLRIGASEFVVGNIPSELIEFQPVSQSLPVDLFHRLDDGSLLWLQLRDFLVGLMEAQHRD